MKLRVYCILWWQFRHEFKCHTAVYCRHCSRSATFSFHRWFLNTVFRWECCTVGSWGLSAGINPGWIRLDWVLQFYGHSVSRTMAAVQPNHCVLNSGKMCGIWVRVNKGERTKNCVERPFLKMRKNSSAAGIKLAHSALPHTNCGVKVHD